MIKTTLFVVLGLLVLAIAAVAVIAALRPDTFRVSRSLAIAAPPERIFPLIDDIHRFNTWNPYNRKDPAMLGSYRGPVSGPGAAYDFRSRKAGSGSIEITASQAPGQVRMRLLMTEPFAADNMITFTLAPQGAAGAAPVTQATWTMEGASPFLAKFMGVIFNMDKMVGTDFEAGLANLKTLAEQPV